MHFAFLDSTYSDYFKDLSRVAYDEHGLKCIRCSYTLADSIYVGDIKNGRRRLKIPEKMITKILESSNYLKSEKYTRSRSHKQHIIKYLERLNYICSNYDIKFVLIYNDRRWNHYYAIKLLQMLAIDYFVIERGIYRGTTSTCDPWGLAGDSQFYFLPLDKSVRHKPYSKVASKIKDASKLKFALHLMVRTIEQHVLGKFVFHNNKSLISYIAKIFKTRQNVSTKIAEFPYTLVPLQLNEDSQIKFHSRFVDGDDFLRECLPLMSADENIVVAHHPEAHKRQITISDSRIVEVIGCSEELIKNAKRIVTINSNVGLEALRLGIPVHFFGKSVGSKHPMAAEQKPGQKLVDIKNARSEMDSIFWSNLLSRYQVFGDIHSYSEEDLKNSVSEFMKRCNMREIEENGH